MESFGKKLKSVRLAFNLSQRDLADKVGVDQTLISQYERGECQPTFQTMLFLTDALGISPTYFGKLKNHPNILDNLLYLTPSQLKAVNTLIESFV